MPAFLFQQAVVSASRVGKGVLYAVPNIFIRSTNAGSRKHGEHASAFAL
jgi:hypothetical protein